ncbi:MAG: 16S rRNA (guanine(527)-N(7))-methyltransferase RsmG [Lentisphaeria bacterium]|nr:16S rRNA (guanine(527)-N(7))-methyltransferase RsmG [Lentisphaeria bacterium]
MRPLPAGPASLTPDDYPVLAFPPGVWERFAAACRRAGIPLEPAARQTLERLYSHLIGVNTWLNLTRITRPEDYLKLHVLDSLSCLPLVRELTRAGDLCLDLGSGAGYPGLPLMTWLPDRRWVLVDSRGRKAAFLREALTLTPCPRAEAAAFRGREAHASRPDLARRCDLVTARAVGKAADLFVETTGLLRPGGSLLLLEGPTFGGGERRAALRAAGSAGFTLRREVPVTLEEGDPERLLVVFTRSTAPARG